MKRNQKAWRYRQVTTIADNQLCLQLQTNTRCCRAKTERVTWCSKLLERVCTLSSKAALASKRATKRSPQSSSNRTATTQMFSKWQLPRVAACRLQRPLWTYKKEELVLIHHSLCTPSRNESSRNLVLNWRASAEATKKTERIEWLRKVSKSVSMGLFSKPKMGHLNRTLSRAFKRANLHNIRRRKALTTRALKNWHGSHPWTLVRTTAWSTKMLQLLSTSKQMPLLPQPSTSDSLTRRVPMSTMLTQ